ncbi:MAG: adenine phosphoribosyltransferase, partial [Elusimicrobiota bacterium]
MTAVLDLKDFVRDIPDFPKKGIMFKDITPLLRDPKAFGAMVDSFVARYQGK